mgnify:CR=1 FL=1
MEVRPGISDKELIRKYLDGDETALERLINKHENRVYAYIFTVVKDKDLADDVFQDAFIKVVNTLRSGNYKEEGKFLQWVMRISHNLIIDHFRKEKRMPVVNNNSDEYDIFETLRMESPSIEDSMVTSQIHKDVRRLVEFLPSEQKEVLKMRHYANMSFKEIAEQTDVSINTALGRMRYALINLRKLVDENNVVLSK